MLQRYSSRELHVERKKPPPPTFVRTLWRFVGSREEGAWPFRRGWEGSCEFHRDCRRCAHWSVCLSHVCFFDRGDAPRDRREPSRQRARPRGRLSGEAVSFRDRRGSFWLCFPPRLPSTVFPFASDPSSVPSEAPSAPGWSRRGRAGESAWSGCPACRALGGDDGPGGGRAGFSGSELGEGVPFITYWLQF